MECLAKMLSKDQIEFHPVNQHIRCMAHVINLCVQDFLKEQKGQPTHDDELELTEGEEEANQSGTIISKVSLFIKIF
jgi:hypothetical protein